MRGSLYLREKVVSISLLIYPHFSQNHNASFWYNQFFSVLTKICFQTDIKYEIITFIFISSSRVSIFINIFCIFFILVIFLRAFVYTRMNDMFECTSYSNMSYNNNSSYSSNIFIENKKPSRELLSNIISLHRHSKISIH